jgi:hypothetical protein
VVLLEARLVEMTPPEAPAAPPPRGRHLRPGKAGSALALASILLFATSTAWGAGGHHSVDDANILDPGNCEFETWVTRASRSDELLHVGGQCGVHGVEIALAAEPSRLQGARSDVWQAQLKWARPLDEAVHVGFSVTPQWDTRSSPRYQGTTLSTLLTLQPWEGWQLHGNLGRDWLHEGNRARSGVAADWTTPDKRLQFAVERYVENRTNFARAGARWFANDKWTFDMSRAQRLDGPRPSNWTLALTRSFAKN